VVDAKHQYIPEFVVPVDRVFSEVHERSTRSNVFRIRSGNAVFEVSEVALESIDMRFEIVDVHQGETKERLIPLWHQRQAALR